MKPLLSVEGLSVGFSTPRGMVEAVKNVSFTIKKGEILALLGETGCGKSVTGRTILALPGVNAKVQGMVNYEEKNLLTMHKSEVSHLRGNEITIIMQNPELALNPVITVGRQLMEPLKHHWKMTTTEAKKRVIRGLEAMGFSDAEEIFNLYSFQLSGGMNQRVMFAASMLTEPALLIADEPTRSLDAELKETIKNRLAACREDYGTAIFLITHDLELAEALADRVAVMYAGELVEVKEMKSFLNQPVHPYSVSLIESYRQRLRSTDAS